MCLKLLGFRAGRCGAVAFALLLCIGGSAGAAEMVRVGGTSAALGTIQLLADRFAQVNPELKIVAVADLASDGGLKALGSGAVDLVVATRALDAGEIRRGLAQREFARTPFVFAVSAKSAVNAITRKDLAGIYSGALAKWPDGTTIRPVLRPVGNRNNALVKRLSREIEQAVSAAEKKPGMQVAITDQEAADKVERVPGAIAAFSLSVILSERRPLRALALDGVAPTPSNAASKAYPLYKPMYFVTAAQPPAAVERFIAFVLSPEGRKVLADNGFWAP
jgi:phosphate transport system substrate-binding protein